MKNRRGQGTIPTVSLMDKVYEPGDVSKPWYGNPVEPPLSSEVKSDALGQDAVPSYYEAAELTADDYPRTLVDVNRFIRHLGVKFVRGQGYYYALALDGKGDWVGEGVYTYRVDGLTLGDWEREAKIQQEKFGKARDAGLSRVSRMAARVAGDFVQDYRAQAFINMTLPLRRRFLYGDEVVFLKDGKVLRGVVDGAEGKNIIVLLDDNGRESVLKDQIRMPKGGVRGRDV